VSARNRKSSTLAVIVLMMCLAGWEAGTVEQQSSPRQQTPPAAAPAAGPAANPADVGSIDTILSATYDTISGPAGQPRDWNRFRSLLVSRARLIPIVPDPQVGFRTLVFSVEDYVKHGDTYFRKNGFSNTRWRAAPNTMETWHRCSALMNRVTALPIPSGSRGGLTAFS
jgi:hypothetical protein